MPSSSYLQAAVGRQLHYAGFQSRGSTPSEVLISPTSRCALGEDAVALIWAAPASTAYNATNRAIGYQFVIAEPFTVQKVWWANGTTATTNNADVAVYTEDGATRIVAGGSTAIATANVVQEKDCTDTVLPGPGRYWCVYAQDGTTATPLQYPNGGLNLTRMAGVAQFAGAVPLGTTFTPAAMANVNIPLFGIAGRTQVA